ncbi:sulfite exporter TauE/SafE family protein [Hydrogenobacter hydrogenophilus]|uniref:Probable membrane transporter protein n=1 Tax=Hydrogenobacter hydrogenophilus TaxID=35835 RepID=A0A285P9F4_9AQUI|nr:sulfite exporter TauE/SafE family protein [Hydrogenobacter hydrogenophilus]SNZ16511.1 hypothetical protein SAMN06265353_1622 [Hydrogenobacter hydrogenophilus]
MTEFLVVLVASFLAGATNAVAGGGTLITFPVLVWLGTDPISANITNTVSLWTGSLFSALGFRDHVKKGKEHLKALLIPSILGGFAGAYLLVKTSSNTFRILIPFLILFATILLMLNEKLITWTKVHLKGRSYPLVFIAQFLTALYGGYFGAGIGIIMLASLGMVGIADIHIANGIKNILGMTINGIASVYFLFSGHVLWSYAFLMMLGFALGGYAGARLSLRFDRKKVKLFVVLWGFLLSLFFFLNSYHA